MTTEDQYIGWSQVPPNETRTVIKQASKAMADLVRSTLGPHGLDKMVVRRMPDDELRGFVTNDGVAIIEEFEGETDHPVAQQFIALAEDHEEDLGDGVTTTFLLACDLLSTAMDLVDRGVHPTDVVEGYSIAAQRTIERWTDMAIPLTDERGEALNRDALEEIAMTGMTNGRTESWPLDAIADTVVEAVLRVSDPATGTTRLDLAETIAVPGGNVMDSELIEGTILPREVVDAEYLLPVEGPVLLIDSDLTSRELSADVDVSVNPEDPTVAANFDESADIATAIGETGAVAVITTGEADMQIAHELAGEGAVLVRNMKDSDFEYVKRVTGATPIGPVTPKMSIDPDLLGYTRVGLRDMRRNDDWLAFEAPSGTGQQAITLVIRGGTTSVSEEAERRVKDGKNALRAVIKDPRALPAGGAADVAAATDVRSFAARFDGREQLAVKAFANVLETIPKTLAHNAGLDPIEALTDLRARHDAGYERAAVSKNGTLIDDVTDTSGLDPFRIRIAGLIRAVEFANNFVCVDRFLVDQREPDLRRILDDPYYEDVPEPDEPEA